MFARRSRFFAARYLVQDLALTALAFPPAYLLRAHMLPHVWRLGPIYPLREYWPLLLGVMVVWPIVGWILGIYRQVDPRQKARLVRGAVVLATIGSVIILAGLYLSRGEYISRMLVVNFWAVDSVFLVCGRLFLFSSTRSRRGVANCRYFLIIGADGPARELASFIEQGYALGDRLIGFAYTGASPPDDLPARHRVLPVAAVPDLLESQPVDEILFAVTLEELGQLESLMRRFQEEGVQTRVHLDFLPLSVSRISLEHLHNVPLLTFSSAPDSEILLSLKRVLDVAVALCGLVLLSFPLLVIALLIRCTSRGPVIYRQTRCGIGGRLFTLYKFRSMVAEADRLRAQLGRFNEAQGPVFKMARDPRVTRVGWWLRRFSLDELPQLWNVVQGNMSIVGPRPPLPEEVAHYEKWQRRRLRMRPGLTCLWALEGRSHIPFDRWMELDLAYIDNWSLWLDAKIFFRTIPYVLRGRGAF